MKSITFLLLPLLFSIAFAGRLSPSLDNHVKAEVINTVPSDGSQNNAEINNKAIPFPWFHPILPPHFFLPPPHFFLPPPHFPAFPSPFPIPSFNGSNTFPFPIPSFNGSNPFPFPFPNLPAPPPSSPSAASTNDEKTPFFPFPWFHPILPPHFFLPPPQFPPFFLPIPSFNGSNPFPFPIPSFNGSNPFPNLPAPPPSSTSAASTNDEKTPFFPFPWFHPILPPHFFLPPPHFPPFFPIPSFNVSNPFPFPIPSFNGSFPFPFPNLPAPPPSSPSAASTNDEKTPFFPFPWFHPILPPHFFLPPPHFPPFFPIPSFNGSNPFPFPIPSFNGSNPFPNLPAPPPSSTSAASTNDEKTPFFPFPWFHPILPPHFFLPPPHFPPFFPIPSFNGSNPFPFPIPSFNGSFPFPFPNLPAPPPSSSSGSTNDEKILFPFFPFHGVPLPWFFHPIVPPHFFLPPFQFPSPINNTNPFPFPFPFPFPSQPPSSPSTPSDNNVEKTSDDQFVFPLPYMGMPPVSDDHMKCYLAVHDRGMASCLNDLHSFFTTHKISISSGCCSALEKIEDSCNTNNPFLENIVNQHCAAPSPSN